jgi:acyl dehydratase
MPLDYDKLKNWKVAPVTHLYTSRDAILYALGIGLGFDPAEENELRFLHEKQLLALPTLATVLGYPWGWIYQVNAGATRLKHVLAEQGITIHKLPPPQGEVISHLGVTNIVDKGKDKGALIYTERKVYEKQSGDLLCTLSNTMFCRADGGFGGPAGPVRVPQAIPQRAPDQVCALPSLRQAALIYQLCGDRNPLHVDPEVARAAGFKRPILHGLCTFGMAGHALLKTYCNYDPVKLLAIEGRFSAPVFPGETVITEMWREGDTVAFRSSVAGRDAIVINNGRAEFSER